MPPPSGNGHPPDDRSPPERGGFAELIAEAEALRQQLAEASIRSARLVAALKQHKRQARAVAAAVVSLRQLDLGG